LELGGVFDSNESSLWDGSSLSEFSSSEIGFARFFAAVVFGFSVVWLVFFGAAFGFGAAATFLGAALAFLDIVRDEKVQERRNILTGLVSGEK